MIAFTLSLSRGRDFLIERVAITLLSWDLDRGTKKFNYRLPRACRTIKNSFGIQTTHWRILLAPNKAKLENVESYVQTAATLHNYLNQTESFSTIQNDYNDGENDESRDRGIIPLGNIQGLRYLDNSIVMREALKEYLNSPDNLNMLGESINITLLKNKMIFFEKQFIIQTGNI